MNIHTDWISRESCPLCNGQEHDVAIAFDTIPVTRCRNCSMMFSSRILSDEAADRYYRDYYGGERQLLGQLTNARVSAELLGRLARPTSDAKLLDVGTGYGALLREAKRRYGCECIGVELSRKEADAGCQMGHNVLGTSLKESGLPTQAFDVVTAFEVLEHLVDPVGFLRDATEYVKPNGCLVIMTDNFESPVSLAMGAAFPKWIPHVHISHFSPRTFRDCVQRAGLKIVGELSFTPWELWALALHRWLRDRLGSEPAAYRFDDARRDEMGGTYRLSAFRRFANVIWTKATCAPSLDGALMCAKLVRDTTATDCSDNRTTAELESCGRFASDSSPIKGGQSRVVS